MAKSELAAKKDMVVSIHYTLKDTKGKQLESSKGEEPLVYLHGHDQIISGLEKAVNGKSKGDKVSVTVQPKDGYGDYNEDMVTTLEKSQFRDQKELKVGNIFQFVDESGEAVVVRIKEVKGNSVIVDGNHPFAGQTLNFDVEVVGVRKATKEEIEHGHAHGEDGHHHH